MRKYLFDSGLLSAYVQRKGSVFDRAVQCRRDGHRLGTATPVVAELVAGLERSTNRETNLDRFRRALPSLKMWAFELDTAYEFGRLFAELMRVGRPMQIVDIQIAAIAFTLGNCTVVTTDSDLSAIPGLAVENWLTTA